jgi:preprotein translocase subunit SecA
MSDNSQEQFDSAAGEEPDSVATKQIDSSAAGPVGANGDAVSGAPKLTLPAVPVTSKLFLWRRRLPQIAQWEPTLQAESQAQLRKRSLSLRYRARSGEKLDSLIPETFALVREAGRRTVEMRHFDVQLLGGLAMFHGSIAEMETGEGKTLTATLPLYVHSLVGKGSHLATVNDYLARRDAEWMMPLYNFLGVSVGIIQTGMNQDERRQAYGADVTYGTAKEFGFDFLRDRLLLRQLGEQAAVWTSGGASLGQQVANEQPVHRNLQFALVDEADSILIDEARTPLIISAIPGEAQMRAVACFSWSAEVAKLFHEDEQYDYDHEKKTIELNFDGRQLARNLEKPEELGPVGLVDMYQYIERAIKVGREFFHHQQYVIKDGEIVIVDEFTGRLAEGRKWSAGLHQAVEAKEGVEVTVETGHAARITVQDLFRLYTHLAGMTGTIRTSAREMKKIYKAHVVVVPTNRKTRRLHMSDLVFANSEQKFAAIVEEVKRLNEVGRPVLIGTRSIDKSERLAKLLTAEEIQHRVLNASHVAAEAEIVAEAGQPGRVTVATNMAGRGTDIKLGEGVADLGGLHVIGTEIHDSARIDRQLEGRCGRQGDLGTFQQYLAMDDEILSLAYGPKKGDQLKKSVGEGNDNAVAGSRLFRGAQRKIERRHFRGRKVLVYHEKHRRKMHQEMGQDPYLDMPDQ